VLRALRADERTRTIPVILLSARSGEASRLEGLAAGTDDYLVKPFSARELLARVDGALRLAQVRREANQKLSRYVVELQHANQELSSFAYSVSHDLRAPLRAMIGFSQALIEDFTDQVPAAARDYLEEISRAGLRMSALIDGILVLSRCTRGDLQWGVVDLSALAERICRALAQSEPTRHGNWQVEPGLVVHGDSRMLEAALENLLGNAWKYTAHVAEAEIRLFSEEHGGERRFCVADNGAGFDMDHADKLFQPFQRLHREDEFPGIGVGLATVQRIIHRHGGNIVASAVPGRGATFTFTLPETAPQGENAS
jgi:signal transduction histidine kinase